MDKQQQAIISAIRKDFKNKNKREPKSELELALFVQSQGGKKYVEKIASSLIQEGTPEQKQKALHGAKLQYLKSLKNQCPEGEELVYYKRGGSVSCGCKKKENGGEVVTAKSGSPVEKFKEVRKGKFGVAAFADATGSQGGFRNAQKKKEEKKPKSGTWGATTQYIPGKNIQRGSGNNTSEQEKKDKSAKDYYSGKGDHKYKKGGEVKKECGGSKVIANFKAKCGTKMRKHELGGSLNRIPFMKMELIKKV